MNKNIKNNSGQAVIIITLIFLAISSAIVWGVITPITSSYSSTKNFWKSKESFLLANSAFEEGIYRLKNNMSLSSEENIYLDQGQASIQTSNTIDGKSIAVSSDSEDFIRNIYSEVITGVGSSFNYGIQVGNGGFSILGSSVVNGNIYAHGPVVGGGGSRVTGSVVSTNSAPLQANQINNSPSTPPNSIIFGNNNATQDIIQSFKVSEDGPANKVRIYIKRTATVPGNLVIGLSTDNGGVPNSTLLTSATLSSSQVATSFGWVDVVFPQNPLLQSGTTYWLVIDGGTNSSKYYTMAANQSYSNGQAKIGRVGSTWSNTSPVGLDSYFEIYLGGIVGTISGDSYDYLSVGTAGVGDAWARTVTSVSAQGKIYCQTGSMNNGKTCDTSKGDPPALNMPLSDANIQSWKDEGAAGQILNGNQIVGWQGATLGPAKIVGNLTVNGGGTLTISGTLYVTGTVAVTGGGKVKLASSYGSASGVVVSDGVVSISGGGQFDGSGTSGSYPMIVSTSKCPAESGCGSNAAITLNGGAGAVVLYANEGTVRMVGGTSARSLVGYKVELDNGASVNYDQGLVDLNFSSGPSGSWNIASWQEVE